MNAYFIRDSRRSTVRGTSEKLVKNGQSSVSREDPLNPNVQIRLLLFKGYFGGFRHINNSEYVLHPGDLSYPVSMGEMWRKFNQFGFLVLQDLRVSNVRSVEDVSEEGFASCSSCLFRQTK